ncbi:hypothetical protein [Bacillus altitudinis]|uniref:hypothetical protein n=1 Tax=Bacillus altitudinis TaxID=293387 RepID=UPI000A7DCAB3|nr:hypothetical protein [Bacillus altitudinis]
MKGGERAFQQTKKRQKSREGAAEHDGQIMLKTTQFTQLLSYLFEKNRIPV